MTDIKRGPFADKGSAKAWNFVRPYAEFHGLDQRIEVLPTPEQQKRIKPGAKIQLVWDLDTREWCIEIQNTEAK